VLPSGLWLSPGNAASHGSMIAESSEAFTISTPRGDASVVTCESGVGCCSPCQVPVAVSVKPEAASAVRLHVAAGNSRVINLSENERLTSDSGVQFAVWLSIPELNQSRCNICVPGIPGRRLRSRARHANMAGRMRRKGALLSHFEKSGSDSGEIHVEMANWCFCFD
jgi:hypothetical protein